MHGVERESRSVALLHFFSLNRPSPIAPRHFFGRIPQQHVHRRVFREAGPQEGLVGGVFEKATYQIRHAGQQFAVGGVDADPAAEGDQHVLERHFRLRLGLVLFRRLDGQHGVGPAGGVRRGAGCNCARVHERLHGRPYHIIDAKGKAGF